MAHDPEQLRNGNGKYEWGIASAARDAEAARLRDKPHRMTYQQIADELGYADRGNAYRGIQRAIRTVLNDSVENLIATEAGLLDELYVSALDVLERDHVMVSHGKIITGDDGTPLLDDGPKLAAVRELRQLRESYRKLLGLDAPSRVSVDAATIGEEITGILNQLATTADDSPDG